MANPGDILAPQLLADGTFEEVVLTPAAIGAASSAALTAESAAREAADSGKVSNYNHADFGEQPNIAPAAVELRDKEEPQFVALRFDLRQDEPWEVKEPSALRTAIGAASSQHTHGYNDIEQALQENAVNVLAAIGAASSQDLATLESSLATLQSDPLGNVYPGAAARAITLHDPANDQTALRIGDEYVDVAPAWKPRFREAIGAASLIDGKVPASQLPPISYQSITHIGDGLTSAFAPPGTLTASDSPSALSVTINGVTQEPGSDYTLNTATNRVVLSDPLPLGDKLVITRPILLPSASTLTAEQLGAATTAALAVESSARASADAALTAAIAGKQPLLTFVGQPTPSNTSIIPLTANSAIFLTKIQPVDFQLQLPQTATAGDRIVVVRNAGTGDGLLHIQRFVNGGWQTLSTLTATGQRASFYRDSTNWSLESAPPHTHPVSEIPIAQPLRINGGGALEITPGVFASTSALAALEARVAALEAASQP
jgi:hypothetical protein